MPDSISIYDVIVNGKPEIPSDTPEGGEGHIILNSSGTAMTQRMNLQFEGMDVTDDSTNNKTKVAPRLDSAPVANSVKGVQSGGTYTAIRNSAFNSFRSQSATNCVNILKPTIESQVVNGITVTVKGYDESLPGTFKLNGTATADIYLQVGCVTKTADAGGYGVSFILRGCPSGGGRSTFYLYEGNASTETVGSEDYGDGEGGYIGTEPSLINTYYDENEYMQIWLYIESGTTISNKTFYPIVYPCYGSDPFDDIANGNVASMWVPYTRSNDALTRDRDHIEMAGYNVQSSDVLAYNQGAFNVQSFTQTGKVPGQPSQYGFMQTMTRGHESVNDSQETHQLWFTQDNGDLYHRGTNFNSYNNPPRFKRILDDSNVASNIHFQYVDMPADPTILSFVSYTAIESGRFIAFKVRDGNNIFGMGIDWYRGFVQYQNITGGVHGYGIVAKQDGRMYSFYVGGDGTSSNPYSIAKCAPIMNEVPRDSALYDANTLPSKNTFRFREVTGTTSQHLPRDGWFHLIDSMGPDSNYNCQLALGMTVDGMWYRKRSGNSWGSWYKFETEYVAGERFNFNCTVMGMANWGGSACTVYLWLPRRVATKSLNLSNCSINISWIRWAGGAMTSGWTVDSGGFVADNVCYINITVPSSSLLPDRTPLGVAMNGYITY